MSAPDVDAAPAAWAFYFAGEGQRVLPIPPRSKAPLLKGWDRLATTDPDQLARIRIENHLD